MGTVMQTTFDPVIASKLNDLTALSETKQGGEQELNKLLGKLVRGAVNANPSLKQQVEAALQQNITTQDLLGIEHSLKQLPDN